jgi:hypothetical protein
MWRACHCVYGYTCTLQANSQDEWQAPVCIGTFVQYEQTVRMSAGP